MSALRFSFLLIGLAVCGINVSLAEGPTSKGCGRPMIVIVDGAGGFYGTTDNFRKVVRRRGHPIDLYTFEWTHGTWRILDDQTDVPWALEKASNLARVVADFHAQNPATPIHVVAHSAGAMIALKALEEMPKGIVGNVVLMAPSVSVHYDVRPALRSVKGKIHNYYSCRDWIYIGVFTPFVGTSDGVRTATAGHKGFQVHFDASECALAEKFVQRPWRFRDLLMGNDGQHYGAYQHLFLHNEIIPLLLAPTADVR